MKNNFISNLKNNFVRLLLQRKNQDPLDISQVKKVLIIRNSGIGDAICLEPMIRELKLFFPSIEIDIFSSLGNRTIFDNLKSVSHVFVKHKKRQPLKRILEFIKMKQRNHDLIIDTTVYHFNKAVMVYCLNPKWAIATENNKKDIMDRLSLSFYINILPSKEKEHTVDKLLRFLNLFGISNYSNKIDLHIPKTFKKKAKTFISKFNGKKVVAINIFATSENRTLSYNQLVSLCSVLQKQDVEILLFFPPEKKSQLQTVIKNNCFTNVNLTYETQSIYDAIALVNYVDLIISPDTGYIHIASALDIPVIGLFWNNKQQIAEWGPRGKISQVITSKIENDNTLKNIDINEISNAVKKILNLKSLN